MDDLFKYLVPIAVFPLWLRVAISKTQSKYVKLGTLYMMSIWVFSSNWQFAFREIHQAIQLLVAICGLHGILSARTIPKFNSGLALFAIFISISATGNLNIEQLALVIGFVLSVFVANYFYIYLWNKDSLTIVFRFVSQVTIVVAIFGLIEYLYTGERVEGPMFNPNYCGYFIGLGYLCTTFCLHGLFRRGILLFLIWVIFLTGSRAALFFPILHLIYVFLRIKIAQKMLIATAISICIPLFFMHSDNRFVNFERTAGSDAERIAFFQIANEMAAEHPFSGVGWGRFPVEYSTYAGGASGVYFGYLEMDMTRDDFRVTHNDLIRILAELGYLAAITSIIYILVGVSRFLRCKVPWPEQTLPMWLGTIAFSLTHNMLGWTIFWIVFLLPFYGRFVRKVPTLENIIQVEFES